MSEVDENLKNAEICWTCGQPFLRKRKNVSPYITKKIQNKVESFQDLLKFLKLGVHSPITRKNRGAAFVISNLNARQAISIFFPTALHNLGSYVHNLFLLN